MTTQPEKASVGQDGLGMATRARFQQPIVSNLFNDYSNLPKKSRTFPDRRVACDPGDSILSGSESCPTPIVMNAHRRGQYLASLQRVTSLTKVTKKKC